MSSAARFILCLIFFHYSRSSGLFYFCVQEVSHVDVKYKQCIPAANLSLTLSIFVYTNHTTSILYYLQQTLICSSLFICIWLQDGTIRPVDILNGLALMHTLTNEQWSIFFFKRSRLTRNTEQKTITKHQIDEASMRIRYDARSRPKLALVPATRTTIEDSNGPARRGTSSSTLCRR